MYTFSLDSRESEPTPFALRHCAGAQESRVSGAAGVDVVVAPTAVVILKDKVRILPSLFC